LITGLRPKRL